MTERSWHLVAYDVRDDARLRLTARLLEGYGERIQYSVFRCRISQTERQRLEWELSQLLTGEDNLLVIPLCQRCSGKVREPGGRKWDEPPKGFHIV